MSIQTTIKTETCSFSEYRIYPGRGSKFIARDGKVHLFISHKCRALFHQKKKPVKLRWTLAWRRANKKFRQSDLGTRRSRKKVARVQKAIVGLSVEELKKKRVATKTSRPAAPAGDVKKAKDAKKKETKRTPQAKSMAPKTQKDHKPKVFEKKK